jgi:hypothetical protein
MNRIITCLLLTNALLTNYLSAQTDTSKSIPQTAITFSFSGFNLGGGIAGRFWLTNQYCLRLGVTGLYESSVDTSPLSDSMHQQYDLKRTEIGINFGLERHFPVNESISPYLGVAAGIQHSQRDDYYTQLAYSTTSRSIKNTYNGMVFLGLEYWVARNITFSGEQSVTFSYYTTTDYSHFEASSSTSSLMISIYF